MRPNVPLDQWDDADVEAAAKGDDVASAVPAAPSAPTPPAPAGPVSRRDFLRRAGREAVQTGTQLVPGATLAKSALGIGPAGADGTPPQSLMGRLAGWRNRRAEATADNGDALNAQPADGDEKSATDRAEGTE